MAKLDRVFFERYGKDGITNDFAEFGSKAEGTPVKTKDIAAIQSLDPWKTGIKNALLAGVKAPFLEDINGWMLVVAYMIANVFESGVPEWEANTSYFIGSIVRKIGTSELYASKTNDNVGNALPSAADDTNWRYLPFLFDGAVTTVKLNDAAVTTPKLNDAAVDEDKLAASVAGPGLVGGAGDPLEVNPDDSTVEVFGDQVRVKADGITANELAGVLKPMKLYDTGGLLGPRADGGLVTLLSVTGPCVLTGLAAKIGTNPGVGSATWQFVVTVDGTPYSFGSWAGTAPIHAVAQDLDTAGPFNAAVGAGVGAKNSLSVYCKTSLTIAIHATGFSDGRWQELVYASYAAALKTVSFVA